MKKIFIVIIALLSVYNVVQGSVHIVGNHTIYYENDIYFVIYQADTFYIDTTTLIIRYESFADNSDISSIENSYGLSRKHEFITGFISYTYDQNQSFINLCTSLTNETNIEIVELNTSIKYLCDGLEPNEYVFDEQWYLERIEVPYAWTITTGDENVVVAILDTGSDWEHNDLGPGNDGYENSYHNPDEDEWTTWNDPCRGDKNYDGNDIIDDWKGYGGLAYVCPPNYEMRNDSRELDLDYLYGQFPQDPETAESLWRHGTFIAGIIGAKTNNNNDIAGIAGGWGSEGVSLLYINLGFTDHPPFIQR